MGVDFTGAFLMDVSASNVTSKAMIDSDCKANWSIEVSTGFKISGEVNRDDSGGNWLTYRLS